MHSYISSSKPKKLFYTTIILVVLAFALVSIAKKIYIHWGYNYDFNSTASSKATFMRRVLGKKTSHAIVFIGSSKTFYGIDTPYIAKQLGIPTFNYGMAGHFTADYPYTLQQTIRLKPKVIVLEIKPNALYLSPTLPCEDLYSYNLYIYYLTHQALKFILDSLGIYFTSNFNDFWYFNSLSLYRFIISEYHQMVNAHTLPSLFHPNSIQVSSMPSINLGNCVPFVQSKDLMGETVIRCRNGDGILLGNTPLPIPTTQRFHQMNADSLALVQYYIKTIKQNGITPIILFPPSDYSIHYTFDLSEIKHTLNVNIIDLSQDSFTEKYWADGAHLNINGRAAFTRILSAQLKKLLF